MAPAKRRAATVAMDSDGESDAAGVRSPPLRGEAPASRASTARKPQATQPTSSATSTRRGPVLARLHVLGPDAESFDICAGETIIGRDEPATILLPSSCVSIKHATIEVSRNGIFHWISDSSTNGTWITRYRNGLETPYRLHSSDKEGEGEIYRYQLVDGEKLKFADMEVIYEVLEPWRTQMGVGHFGAGLPSYTEESSERDNEVAEEQVEEQAEVADNDVGQRRMLVGDSQQQGTGTGIRARRAPVTVAEHSAARETVFDSAPSMLARGDSLVQEPQGSNTDYLSARAILEEPPVCAVEEDVGRESERDEYYAADAPEQPFMVEAPASETRNESPEAREPDHEKELEAIETETTRPLENAVPMPLDVAPVPQASEVSPAPTDTTNADIKKAKSKKTRGKETVPMVVSQIGETGRKRGRKKYVGASDDEDSRRKSHRKDSSEDSKAVTVADGGRLQPDAEVAQASAPNDPLPAPSLADAPAFPPLAESEDEPESQPVGIRRRVKAVPTWSDEDAEVEKPAPSEKPASLPAPIANSDQAPPEFLGEEKQEAEQTPAPAAVENSSRKGKVAKSGAVPAKRTSPRKASKSKQPVDLGVFEVPVTSSGASDDIASYGAEEKIEKPAKKQKKGKSVKAESTSAKPSPARRSRNEDVVPPPNLDGRTLPKVAFTGLDGDELDAQQKVVLDLGGELTDSVQEATHLVADKARRTIKLLCAVARGLPVISVGWLEACRRASTFVEDTKHIIRDKETEKKWGYSLTNSIEVARGKPLFQGKKFYITAHNKSPKLEDLKAVIEAAGGKVLDDIPDPGTKDKASIVILGCQEDDAFCRQLDSQGFSVQTNEYVLTGVLRQQDNPTEFKFVTGAGAVESPSKGTKRKR